MNDKGEIFDPLGVYDDLKLELIRILSPREKFEEDPTRILRVLRFSQELGFEIEEHTLAAIHSSNLALSYSHGLASEIEKILQLSPSDRKKIFGLSEDLGLAHLFQQALIVYGENLIQSNPRLENYLAKLQKITGIANTYVFGGTLRDILLKKEFKDMDIKLDESTGALVRKLRQLGFQETDDVELPPNTFYFNERFGAVSIKIEEMIYDFTESGDANEQEWYLNNDINFNSMIFNPVTGKIDNLQLIPEVILGFITLTERYFKRDVTELRIVNYLKQLTRSANLYVSEDDLDYVQKNMGEVLNYFLRYPRMMYKLESLLGNENTDNVLRMIAQSKSGEKLISLLNAYVSEES
jgi:hypothetical protein